MKTVMFRTRVPMYTVGACEANVLGRSTVFFISYIGMPDSKSGILSIGTTSNCLFASQDDTVNLVVSCV